MRLAFICVFATALALPPVTAQAEARLMISFDMEDVTILRHDCGEDGPLTVSYVNSDTEALALVPVEGVTRIFAATVSASGAVYISGQLEWITRGEAGTLRDTLANETLLDCGFAVR